MKKIVLSLILISSISLSSFTFAADPQPTNPPTPTVPANPNGPGNTHVDPGERTSTSCTWVEVATSVWSWFCWTRTIKKIIVDEPEPEQVEQNPIGSLYCPDVKVGATTLSNVRVNLISEGGTVKVTEATFILPANKPFSATVNNWLNTRLNAYGNACYNEYMGQ
ncbi:MAG: hypothetical protein J0L93_08565 [Deltaproteobacteria bacterium]|nr:hypothetical protein [Deltaproteobacteria bacterium]